jgi:hypothetical protein
LHLCRGEIKKTGLLPESPAPSALCCHRLKTMFLDNLKPMKHKKQTQKTENNVFFDK